MGEDFAFCVCSELLQRSESGHLPPGLADGLAEAVRDLTLPDTPPVLESGSAGYGASMETILVIVTGLLAIGPAIEQNLKSWPSIGRRAEQALRKLRNQGHVLVAEPVALSMLVAEMERRGIPVGDARLLASHVIPVRNTSVIAEAASRFRAHPDRYYVFILRDDDDDTHVAVCRSTGAIESVERLVTGNYMEYAGLS